MSIDRRLDSHTYTLKIKGLYRLRPLNNAVNIDTQRSPSALDISILCYKFEGNCICHRLNRREWADTHAHTHTHTHTQTDQPTDATKCIISLLCSPCLYLFHYMTRCHFKNVPFQTPTSYFFLFVFQLQFL